MLDTENSNWEFFSPFAHIPGSYEWCRIHSPTHESFDCFIVLAESTAKPPLVYVNSSAGMSFMQDRYPESRCIMVPETRLKLGVEKKGLLVIGELHCSEGPVRKALMRLEAKESQTPRQEAYGSDNFAVWGSRWSCEGIDLNMDASCNGTLEREDGYIKVFKDEPCIVTAGSFARIRPL